MIWHLSRCSCTMMDYGHIPNGKARTHILHLKRLSPLSLLPNDLSPRIIHSFILELKIIQNNGGCIQYMDRRWRSCGHTLPNQFPVQILPLAVWMRHQQIWLSRPVLILQSARNKYRSVHKPPTLHFCNNSDLPILSMETAMLTWMLGTSVVPWNARGTSFLENLPYCPSKPWLWNFSVWTSYGTNKERAEAS